MSEWIKTSDRLPPTQEWVLVTCEGDYNEKKVHVGRIEIKGNIFEVGHNPLDYYGTRAMYATHWMECPKLPEDK